MAPRGTSLHIGVGTPEIAVDTPDGPQIHRLVSIPAAENDATAMATLVEAAFGKDVRADLPVKKLLGSDATAAAVRTALTRAAKEINAGDLFVLTFAGHGAQFEELTAPRWAWPRGARSRVRDEDDGHDEAWCLWDDVMLDDELNVHLQRFKQGVRIFVLSDTCHAGTGLRDRAAPGWRALARELPGRREQARADTRRKAVEPGRSHRKPDGAGSNTDGKPIEASVLFIPACAASATIKDHIRPGDPAPQGHFTAAVLRAWNGGQFDGDHHTFHQAIKRACGPGQVPELEHLGTGTDDFAGCRPFTPAARRRGSHVR